MCVANSNSRLLCNTIYIELRGRWHMHDNFMLTDAILFKQHSTHTHVRIQKRTKKHSILNFRWISYVLSRANRLRIQNIHHRQNTPWNIRDSKNNSKSSSHINRMSILLYVFLGKQINVRVFAYYFLWFLFFWNFFMEGELVEIDTFALDIKEGWIWFLDQPNEPNLVTMCICNIFSIMLHFCVQFYIFFFIRFVLYLIGPILAVQIIVYFYAPKWLSGKLMKNQVKGTRGHFSIKLCRGEMHAVSHSVSMTQNIWSTICDYARICVS